MMGQLAAWIIEVWYAFLIGSLSPFYDMDTLREVATLVKNLEFLLIPLVEVYTSAPIREYCQKSRNGIAN